MVAEAMYQNVVALHATDRMLDKDSDLTSDFIRRLLFFASSRARILFTLARLLMRDVNLLSTIVRWHTQITSVDKDIDVSKPIDIWWQFFLQHAVIMVMTTQCSPEKNDELVRKGHDRVFQGMLFFFPL
jgi:hypothetical protein